MTGNRPYIVEYTDLGAEDLSLPPFQLRVQGSSNADARTAFKQYMKAECRYDKYPDIMIYSENDAMGYHGIMHLAKTDTEIGVAYEIFDQAGELTFKEMWEAID